MQLTTLKAIVTGAASGMGRHFALRLAQSGAQVTAGDVNEEGLGTLAKEAQGAAGKLHTMKLNVADEASVETFVAGAAERMGGLNAVVNNAGILRDGLIAKRDKETGQIKTLTTAQWQAVIDTNLTGPFLVGRAAVARMLATHSPGVVVNMSSISRYGNRGQSNYSAAKAGLAAMTRVWALDLAPYNIRVGAIAPGFVDTPILMGMPEKAREAAIKSVPLAKLGSCEEIWLAVKFILECDFFTGRTIDVDGGATL